MKKTILQAKDISFSYHSKGETLNIFKKLNLEIKQGETFAIIGASGSGKSTLLHLLAGLDLPDEGQILLNGEIFSEAKKKNDRERTAKRNRYLGFVYQFHHLLGEFSAQENVAMPLLIQGQNKKTAMQEAKEKLEKVGLGARLKHKPHELSGGERQRTAIARALISKPKCLLADEPTGNLDQENAQHIFNLLKDLVAEEESALILVSHDLELARQSQSCWQLQNGQLIPYTQL